MKWRVLSSLWAVVTCMANTSYSTEQPEPSDVAQQLTQRSGLPEATLQGLLSHCHASQQAMYFCAWRDLLSADAKLDERSLHAGKAGPHPVLPNATGLADWRKQRDKSCATSAAADYAGGSMEATARLLCIKAATEHILAQLNQDASHQPPP